MVITLSSALFLFSSLHFFSHDHPHTIQALKAQGGNYDQSLFEQVRGWYEELDKRMGLLKYCKQIRGQGWDGECLAVDNWWNNVKNKKSLDKPWQSH